MKNMNNMMKQAQKLQKKMLQAQEELALKPWKPLPAAAWSK